MESCTPLYDGSYTLPYLIVKASTVWTRYNFNPNNQQFGNLGAVTCTSVDATDVVTTNGPNKPVDSDDNVIPAIGVGGFTFFHHPTEQTCIMPSGGFFMVIGETEDGVVKIERVAGGVGSQAYHDACIFRLS